MVTFWETRQLQRSRKRVGIQKSKPLPSFISKNAISPSTRTYKERSKKAPKPASPQIQRVYVDVLADKLGIKMQEDWYRLSHTSLKGMQHGDILNSSESLLQILERVYPEFTWHVWKFEKHIPKNFYHKLSSQRSFFDWYASENGVLVQDDWYSVQHASVSEQGGLGIMQMYYSNSLIKTLTNIYPEYIWYPWKFAVVNHGYWEDMENQRSFFNWLGEELGIRNFEDWYSVSYTDLLMKRGIGLLSTYYRNSVALALKTVYPEYPWQLWRFARAPNRFWTTGKGLNSFMEWASKELDIEQPEDWYRVSCQRLVSLGGVGALGIYGSLYNILVKCYPSVTWEKAYFDNRTKTQTTLLHVVDTLFRELGPVHIKVNE